MSVINLGIGKKLRERRVHLGISQETLGKGIGLSSQQVQKYEKGANSMTATRLHEFATFLKVTPAYFFKDIDASHTFGGVAEADAPLLSENEESASDRELIEAMKAFKKIGDKLLRRRVADLLRTLSQKD